MTFLNFGERDDVLVKGRITWKIDKLWRKKLQCSSLPKFWETKWAYVYWGYGVSFIKGWRAEITFFLSRTEQIVQACNYRAGPLLRPYVTDLIKGLVVKARPNKVWPITRERCYSSWGQLAWCQFTKYSFWSSRTIRSEQSLLEENKAWPTHCNVIWIHVSLSPMHYPGPLSRVNGFYWHLHLPVGSDRWRYILCSTFLL